MGVDYYKRNGMGREISKQEALELIKKADKEGLVLQPSFSKKITNICCCCGCCCQVLKTIKRHPRPADMVSSPFIAEFKEESCSGCGICVERCQMDALYLEGDKAVLDATQCIGCGLCVTTCPTDSLYLVRKPEEEQIEIPDNMAKAYIQRAISRGWFAGRFRLLQMVISSKLGRFLVCRKKAH
jgi:NAD-dependent dihydropyrimidine dehydrogenase PreA subunit